MMTPYTARPALKRKPTDWLTLPTALPPRQPSFPPSAYPSFMDGFQPQELARDFAPLDSMRADLVMSQAAVEAACMRYSNPLSPFERYVSVDHDLDAPLLDPAMIDNIQTHIGTRGATPLSPDVYQQIVLPELLRVLSVSARKTACPCCGTQAPFGSSHIPQAPTLTPTGFYI